jgi:hypothetical protein
MGAGSSRVRHMGRAHCSPAFCTHIFALTFSVSTGGHLDHHPAYPSTQRSGDPRLNPLASNVFLPITSTWTALHLNHTSQTDGSRLITKCCKTPALPADNAKNFTNIALIACGWQPHANHPYRRDMALTEDRIAVNGEVWTWLSSPN